MTLEKLVELNGGPLETVFANRKKEVARSRNGRFWLVVEDGEIVASVEVSEPKAKEPKG